MAPSPSAFLPPLPFATSRSAHLSSCPRPYPSIRTALYRRHHQSRISIVASSVADSSPVSTSVGPSGPLVYTGLANNAFALTHCGTTLLIDPWLTGDLVFFSPSFFRGRKPIPTSNSPNPSDFDLSSADAILLTQGLPDHAHPPTLAKLPRDIPIIAPPSARAILQSFSFTRVTIVSPDDVIRPVPSRPDIILSLGRGSVVGPPWSAPQLALHLSFGMQPALTLYHEPHGNHDPLFLARHKHPDVAIAPVVATQLPALRYFLVNGVPQAIELCRAAQPRQVLLFDNSSGEQTGWLSKQLRTTGGPSEFRQAVKKEGLENMEILSDLPVMTPIVIAGKC